MSPVTMPHRELERERSSDERDRAQRRLEDALQWKDRSSARLDAVQGTADELDAFVQLQDRNLALGIDVPEVPAAFRLLLLVVNLLELEREFQFAQDDVG